MLNLHIYKLIFHSIVFKISVDSNSMLRNTTQNSTVHICYYLFIMLMLLQLPATANSTKINHSTLCTSLYLFRNFFLALTNIPVSECTTVHLSVHLLKNLLVASCDNYEQSLNNYEQSCYKYPCGGFYMNTSFQLIWVNNEESYSESYSTSIFSFATTAKRSPKEAVVLHSHQK